eukprot:2438284-Pyramimonas_sp.AAC.1
MPGIQEWTLNVQCLVHHRHARSKDPWWTPAASTSDGAQQRFLDGALPSARNEASLNAASLVSAMPVTDAPPHRCRRRKPPHTSADTSSCLPERKKKRFDTDDALTKRSFCS